MSDTTSEVEELLAAGAVLPPDGDRSGERTVPLSARTYRHPVLADRVVVRLVDDALGTAEDTAVGFLGMTPAAEPAVVGLGLRQSLHFPEWVVVHYSDDAHHALALVPELERIARMANSTPRFAVDAYHALADKLAQSVPHFLPTFYEQAGRVMAAESEDRYASQLFTRARKAEAEHGLAVDLDRLETVYLEFALAQALPATAIATYAKHLEAQLPAVEALDRFCRLVVRTCDAKVAPSSQAATAVRRMVRAATKAGDGAAADAREQAYLVELLALPATLEAPAGWWKAHRPTFVALCQRDPAVRGTLLNLMPDGSWESAVLAGWLDLLLATEATEGLVDDKLPAAQRPADGSAGWLRRVLKQRHRYTYSYPDRLPTWYPLVERMAKPLRAELAGTDKPLDAGKDIDLLDLLLTLGLPVAVPESTLDFESWGTGDGQRDLLALSGDARFHDVLRRGVDNIGNSGKGRRAIQLLAASPGGRTFLVDWIHHQTRKLHDAGLPGLRGASGWLTWLPREALALAPEEVAGAARFDLAATLARTLRGGIFDELGWPAWEEAVADVVDATKLNELVVADAWPHLVVAGPVRARVIDGDGTVLTHDLRIPAGDVWGEPGYHHVDGELLVYWDSYEQSRTYNAASLRGYWHSSADSPQTLAGNRSRNQPRTGKVTLPLPGGGRTTGDGVLHVGDTAVPEEREVISDGTSFWVHTRCDDCGSAWHEYDPASGTCGQAGMPGFLADALRTAPEDSVLWSLDSWVRPAPSHQPGPLGVPVDGLLGWRVVRLPDGTVRGEDLAGRTVTVSHGTPVAALTLPGDDRPRALLGNNALVDPDGVVTAEVEYTLPLGELTTGRNTLPPTAYWHHFRPRDPEGSAALRRLDRETAAALLKGAAEPDSLPALVRAMLPQLSHDALVAGVARLVQGAAAQQEHFDKLTERVTTALAGGGDEDPASGPTDELLGAALDGLTGAGHWYWRGEPVLAFRQLQLLARQRQAPADTPAVPLHFDGPSLPRAYVDWLALLEHLPAVAVRGAFAATTPEHREALRDLLTTLDGLGLTAVDAAASWRRFSLHLEDKHLTKPDGTRHPGSARHLMPLGGTAFLAVMEADSELTVLYHDPAGEFAVPYPYTVRSSTEIGTSRPAGWLATYLTEFADRGPAPWRPELAEEFAQLTGVTRTVAAVVLAGMPLVDAGLALPTELRKLLGVKVADFNHARHNLARIGVASRRAVVAALLPADPARLWTDGPDVAAAAAVWNEVVGRRVPIPERLAMDAAKAVRSGWSGDAALPALLEPAAAPELSNDLVWRIRNDKAAPAEGSGTGFTGDVLVGAVATAAWTAHQVAAGDPVRAALPAALAAVRDRLTNPSLMLGMTSYIRLENFRKVAGAPTETGDGFLRYGAVVLATYDDLPYPALLVAQLDDAGEDPYLPALRGGAQRPSPEEVALRAARDPRFAALLADPGDPVAGERDADGTWWPQDPTRSVPDLVAEVAATHDLDADAAALYLAVLAMPDPTDRNVMRWNGWKAARFKAARAALAGTDLVVEATRTRAGRSLFLPGPWLVRRGPQPSIEEWKAPLADRAGEAQLALSITVPWEPVPDVYRRAWQRLRDGDAPRFTELELRQGRRR